MALDSHSLILVLGCSKAEVLASGQRGIVVELNWALLTDSLSRELE